MSWGFRFHGKFGWSPSRLRGDTFSISDRRTAYAYNPEPPMYTPSGAASYFEASGGAQVTVAGSSPSAVPSHSMVGITMDVGGSPIVSGAGAYLIHGGMDSARHSLAHTSRSSPATVGPGPEQRVSSGPGGAERAAGRPRARQGPRVLGGGRAGPPWALVSTAHERKPCALAVPSRSPPSLSSASYRRGPTVRTGTGPGRSASARCVRAAARLSPAQL